MGTWLWVSRKALSFILCLGHREICYFPLNSTHEGNDPRAERPRYSLFIIFHLFWLKCHLILLCLKKSISDPVHLHVPPNIFSKGLFFGFNHKCFPINVYNFSGYLHNQDLSTEEILMVCYGGVGLGGVLWVF